MTTITYSSFLDHTSDAGFRAWGSELNANLAAIGLVQTADTGQINWTTVLRPAVNVVAGYEIWRFADSTLFIKLEFGTNSSSAVIPQTFNTVGTGSNGSGTITGQTNGRGVWSSGQAVISVSTNYVTYLCRTADALTIQWKVGSAGAGYMSGLLAIGKTVDSSGLATTDGFGVLRMNTVALAPALQCVRLLATATAFTDNNNFVVFPGSPTSSNLPFGSQQSYMCWMNMPDVRPYAWAIGVIVTELPKGSSTTVSMVGAVSHTYMSQGVVSSATINGQSSAIYTLALLYE